MEVFYQVSHPFQADVVAYIRKVGFVFVRERLVCVFSFLNFFKQDLLILFRHFRGFHISVKQDSADSFCSDSKIITRMKYQQLGLKVALQLLTKILVLLFFMQCLQES